MTPENRKPFLKCNYSPFGTLSSIGPGCRCIRVFYFRKEFMSRIKVFKNALPGKESRRRYTDQLESRSAPAGLRFPHAYERETFADERFSKRNRSWRWDQTFASAYLELNPYAILFAALTLSRRDAPNRMISLSLHLSPRTSFVSIEIICLFRKRLLFHAKFPILHRKLGSSLSRGQPSSGFKPKR